MIAFHCPRCGNNQALPETPAACPQCGQAFSGTAGPAAALLLQCLGQALLQGAVTALGAALASNDVAEDAQAPGAERPGGPAPPGVVAELFGGAAPLARGEALFSDPGSAVDAVFGAAGEAGLPDGAGNPPAPSLSGGPEQGRAEAVLREGITAALQELQRGGLVDLVRALRERPE